MEVSSNTPVTPEAQDRPEHYRAPIGEFEKNHPGSTKRARMLFEHHHNTISSEATTINPDAEPLEMELDVGRYWENKICDLKFEIDTNKAKQEEYWVKTDVETSKEKFRRKIDEYEQEIYTKFPPSSENEFSVYEGNAGIALMYMYLYLKEHSPAKSRQYLDRGFEYIKAAKEKLNKKWDEKGIEDKDVSFLRGAAGVLAIASVFYHMTRRTEESRAAIQDLEKLSKWVLREDFPSNGLMNGRAGYLYALIFVHSFFGGGEISENTIWHVTRAIVADGARDQRGKHYMWEDDGVLWLGASKGVSGIVYTLMHVTRVLKTETCTVELIKTIEYLVSVQFPSGNFPERDDNRNQDTFVQWCSGAPGVVPTLLMAHRDLPKHQYESLMLQDPLMASEKGGDCVWRRGLLKKRRDGTRISPAALCHGICGNAYTFLYLYAAFCHDQRLLEIETKNDLDATEHAAWDIEIGAKRFERQKHLYRAVEFANFAVEKLDEWYNHKEIPNERNYSLFEGLAGAVWLLKNIVEEPDVPKFPGFDVPFRLRF